jgi:thiaminase/transcriptional activator TenA
MPWPTLASAKAPNPDRIVQFAKAAEGALVVERALHGSFFKQYGITPRAFAQTPLSPACHHYISYLLGNAGYQRTASFHQAACRN